MSIKTTTIKLRFSCWELTWFGVSSLISPMKLNVEATLIFQLLDICASLFYTNNEAIRQVFLLVWNQEQAVSSVKKVIVNSGCNLLGYGGQNFTIQTLLVSTCSVYWWSRTLCKTTVLQLIWCQVLCKGCDSYSRII